MKKDEAFLYKDKVEHAADFLKNRIKSSPVHAILTGTGLGAGLENMDVEFAMEYGAIPDFPVSTVESHKGEFIAGIMDGVSVFILSGRFHLYEGYAPSEVTFPIRVLQTLGVKNLIVTNASGGLNPDFSAGDIMMISDHINLSGTNPLMGFNMDHWGVRFPDMSAVYDRELMAAAEASAAAAGVEIKKGVYAGLLGPSLETPAELRFLRRIGADSVGLSTIQEVIAAVHAGMSILGLSVVTNIADPDNPAPATIEEIISTAEETAPVLHSLIQRIIGRLK